MIPCAPPLRKSPPFQSTFDVYVFSMPLCLETHSYWIILHFAVHVCYPWPQWLYVCTVCMYEAFGEWGLSAYSVMWASHKPHMSSPIIKYFLNAMLIFPHNIAAALPPHIMHTFVLMFTFHPTHMPTHFLSVLKRQHFYWLDLHSLM